jgi:signal transduction histidine kinase
MKDRRPRAQLYLPARWRAGLAVIGVVMLLLVGCAALNACRSHGRAFPSLVTDPWGSFSAVWWPGWEPTPAGVRFPDRLVAIDGEPIGAEGPVAEQIAARMARTYRSGRRQTTLTFRTRAGPVTVTRALRTFGVEEVLFFFGLYALTGLFVLWSGVMAVIFARRRSGAIAYGWWSVGAFMFLICFYDYHTTTRLVPLFAFSTVWVQICVIRLAYWFPAPPLRHRRALRAAVRLLTGAGAVAAAGLLIGGAAGADVGWLRVAVAHSALGSLLVLTIAIVLRLRTGPAESRREVRSAAWGLAVAPAVLALGFMLIAATGIGIVHVLLPFVAPLVPLSIGYSLIRHNILGVGAVLSRRLLLVPIVSGSVVAATVVWLVVHAWIGRSDVSALVPWGPSLATLAVLSGVGYRFTSRIFFPARAGFRPTIQQLADDLASKRDADSIERSIAASVVRWLSTDSARVVRPEGLHQIQSAPTGHRQRLAAGEVLWTAEPPWSRNLLLPMRSQGELCAVLVLAPKRRRAIYTREDIDLLETIASLGAVALHNADVIAERETLGRFERDAARDDKRLTLGLLGAEVAHEIAYPLNFLRYLLGQGSVGHTLDARDVDIAREEIGRLERMFSTLRKLRMPVPRLQPVLVLPRARRALDLIRESIVAKGIAVTVDLPPDLTVRAEPDPLVQIFANLLRNAAQAVTPGQQIGICWRREGDGIAIEVWDTGPGPSDELQDRLFTPFVTDKEGSMGLGLAVTSRLVASFGWRISTFRRDGRTVFRIDVPSDTVRPQEPSDPS